jgi:penicillin-binding protein 2
MRLYHLQVIHQQKFASLGKRNYLHTKIIHPPRGNFYDCHGRLLATNRPIFDLYWVGSGNWRLNQLQHDLLKQLQNLGAIKNADDMMRNLQTAERYGKKKLITSNIDFSVISKISELCPCTSNLMIESTFKRMYPHATRAAHLLGYLGRHDALSYFGRNGLEKLLQKQLQGKRGYATHIVNAMGKQHKQKVFKPPEPGSDITLTLNLDLQEMAEDLFSADQAGAFILIDPSNGDIKALASFPTFDPNMFLEPLSPALWQKTLQNNNPFLNRATNAAYPPASLFKLVTFSTGLEENIVADDTLFTCEGYTVLGNRKYLCQRHWGHGTISIQKALAYSCNIHCYEIAKHISIDQLAGYAARFGLGAKTNFLLSEHRGLVPTAGWKNAVKGESWWKGETLCAAIGQSFLLVTPLQIARMIGSIFTGFLVKPRILNIEPIEKKPLLINSSTQSFLRNAMQSVVQHGTARIFKTLKNFIIFAKTGTAQTTRLKKKRASKKEFEHAWFTICFQYKDQSPLVLVVLVEHAGSSRPARAIAYQFLRAYEKLYA